MVGGELGGGVGGSLAYDGVLLKEIRDYSRIFRIRAPGLVN